MQPLNDRTNTRLFSDSPDLDAMGDISFITTPGKATTRPPVYPTTGNPSELSQVSNKLRAMTAQNEKNEKQLATYKKQKEEAENALIHERQNSKLSRAQESKKALTENDTERRKALETARQELREANKTIAKLTDDKKGIRDNAVDAVNQWKDARDVLVRKLQDVQQCLEEKEGAVATQQQLRVIAEAETARTATSLKDTKSAYDHVYSDLERARNDLVERTLQLSTLQGVCAEASELRKTIEAMSRERAVVDHRAELLGHDIARAKASAVETSQGIESLRSRVHACDRDLTERNVRIAELTQKVFQLQSELNTAVKEKMEAVAEKQTFKLKESALLTKASHLTSELSVTKASLDDITTKSEDLASSLRAMEKDMSKQHAQLTNTKHELDATQRDKIGFQDSLTRTAQELSMAQAFGSEQSTKVRTLTGVVQMTEERLMAAEADHTSSALSAATLAKSLEQQLDASRAETKTLQRSTELVARDLASEVEGGKKLRAALQMSQGEVASLSEKLQSVSASHVEMESRHHAAASAGAEASHARARAESELAQTRKEIEGLRAQLETCQVEAMRRASMASQELDVIRCAKDQIYSELCTARVEMSQQSVASARASDDKSVAIAGHVARLAECARDMVSIRGEVAAQATQIAALTAKAQRDAASYDAIKERVAKEQAQTDILRMDVVSKQFVIERLEAEVVALSGSRDALTLELDGTKKRVAMANEATAAANSKLEGVRATLQVAEHDNTTLTTDLEKAKATLMVMTNDAIEKTEHAAKREKSFASELAETRESSQLAVAKYKAEAKTMTESLRTHKLEVEKLYGKMREAMQGAEHEATLRTALENRCNALEVELDSKELEACEAQSMQASQVSAGLTREANLTKKITALNADVDHLRSQLKASVHDATTALNTQRQKSLESDATAQHLKERVAALKAEDGFKDKYKELAAKYKQEHANFETLREQTKSYRAAACAFIATQRSELESAVDSANVARAAVVLLHGAMERMQGKVDFAEPRGMKRSKSTPVLVVAPTADGETGAKVRKV